ncbi:MAG: alpha/beta hydrolase [Hyphomonadaceae bacterium]
MTMAQSHPSPTFHDVVDTAYEIASEPARFDDLLDIARRYLFDPPKGSRTDTSVNEVTDPALERRMNFLSGMLERELNAPAGDESLAFHAQLRIRPSNWSVTGNAAAQRLVGRSFPCELTDLPFDYETQKTLQRDLAPGASTRDLRDRVFLTTVEGPEVRSCLALVQRAPERDGDVIVSISYIDWCEPLLGRLQEAFSLTASEREVLVGHLNRNSQKEIAEQRGTSLDTVKEQSKSILKKTGVARMADVVQLSASIAYLLRNFPDVDAHSEAPSLRMWKTPIDGVNYLDIPGKRTLGWRKIGGGDKPVLFVHGFIQGPFFSRAFVRALDAHDMHLICPSRPGFGQTSPSCSRAGFEKTVIEDARALVDHLALRKFGIATHQGGVSHAFRIAAAFGDRVQGMVMIGAGIPIDESRHLNYMNIITRLAGLACKRAPSVMSMVMNLGLPVYKQRGIEWFLRDYLKEASPQDQSILDDPEVLRLDAYGCFHIVEQGAETWIRDGASAMADWTASVDAVTVPRLWIQGELDPVISPQSAREFLSTGSRGQLEVASGAGFNILHQSPDEIVSRMSSFLDL